MVAAPACYSSKMTMCKNISAELEEDKAEEDAPTFADDMNRHIYPHQDHMEWD